jgi:hypothetical protein
VCDRTQPGLPLERGRCGTMTHDYIRMRIPVDREHQFRSIVNIGSSGS